MSAPPDVRLLQNRIAVLEEEKRQLRELLVPPVVFPSTWRLTRPETSLLAALYATKGELCTKERLYAALYSGCADEGPDPVTVTVLLGRLRRKLQDASTGVVIETDWGRGYHLTLASVRQLHAVLQRRVTATAVSSDLARAG